MHEWFCSSLFRWIIPTDAIERTLCNLPNKHHKTMQHEWIRFTISISDTPLSHSHSPVCCICVCVLVMMIDMNARASSILSRINRSIVASSYAMHNKIMNRFRIGNELFALVHWDWLVEPSFLLTHETNLFSSRRLPTTTTTDRLK